MSEIANTIYQQIGGGKAMVMTGGQPMINGDDLEIRMKAKNEKKINHIIIHLNDVDLYDVTFGKIHKVKGIPTYKEIEKYEDIYADMLKETIEDTTGLRLSL